MTLTYHLMRRGHDAPATDQAWRFYARDPDVDVQDLGGAEALADLLSENSGRDEPESRAEVWDFDFKIDVYDVEDPHAPIPDGTAPAATRVLLGGNRLRATDWWDLIERARAAYLFDLNTRTGDPTSPDNAQMWRRSRTRRAVIARRNPAGDDAAPIVRLCTQQFDSPEAADRHNAEHGCGGWGAGLDVGIHRDAEHAVLRSPTAIKINEEVAALLGRMAAVSRRAGGGKSNMIQHLFNAAHRRGLTKDDNPTVAPRTFDEWKALSPEEVRVVLLAMLAEVRRRSVTGSVWQPSGDRPPVFIFTAEDPTSDEQSGDGAPTVAHRLRRLYRQSMSAPHPHGPVTGGDEPPGE